jgi:hypothetical protein
MEEITRAITISADITTLTPYLQQRGYLQQWMHPLIEKKVETDGRALNSFQDYRIETLESYWETVKTEFWMSERRQIFVVTLPPPAPHPAYLIEVQSLSDGVVVVAKIHVPDTIVVEQIENYKAMMAQSLGHLKIMVEAHPSDNHPW